ncbi:ankyrin repeat domain-containing protein 54-like isoform X2 [Microplitis mediator]|uniref:ankyrin repeat domain-containing protein 54-like isoform X2 n=1 Tax=Microplitis mediator TaxID=375433 RepID=UPI002554A425|nr:ankyrin repeat domain-containing protein 54-like isoform X2 [Microplitis mediator]
MTSVDSGVETGNDSNDSAQTENNQSNNQTFNDVDKIMSSTVDLDKQFILTSNHKQQLESTAVQIDFESSPSATTTIVRRSDNSHSLLSRNSSGVVASSEPLVDPISNDSPSSEKLQFRMPPNFKITQKSLRKGLSWSPIKKPRRLKNSIYGSSWERQMRLAAATNNIELLNRLLEKGVSPNNHDDSGRSPLHLASCRGYTEIVKLLLDYGANPNQTDCIGNTPLHLAAVTSKISVVTLLLKAGTDVLSSDRHGYNPLQLAQTKLRMLQNCHGSDMNKIKDEVHKIVGMLLAYLQKQKDVRQQIETLSSFCSRITLSNTTDQVQDDLKDLLASIDSLSLTN